MHISEVQTEKKLEELKRILLLLLGDVHALF